MNQPGQRVRAALERSGVAFQIIDCDPSLADTADFCRHYGYPEEESANAILVKTKTAEPQFALCVVLATCRLDVNKVVRKKFGVRKVSFASAEEARDLTGMEIGGVTPFDLPPDLPVWVDARIMACERVILGGGDRASKVIVTPAIFSVMPMVEVVEGLAYPYA